MAVDITPFLHLQLRPLQVKLLQEIKTKPNLESFVSAAEEMRNLFLSGVKETWRIRLILVTTQQRLDSFFWETEELIDQPV